MNPSLIPVWLEAIGTFGAVLVALFREPIRTHLKRPILTVSAELAPPGCHKTRIARRDYRRPTQSGIGMSGHVLVSGGLQGFVNKTGFTEETTQSSVSAEPESYFSINNTLEPAPDDAEVYYLRLKISNNGKRKASDVEVFASELKEEQTDGTFRTASSFLPTNLCWSHTRAMLMPSIAQGTFKHCDLAHIIKPEQRKKMSQNENNTWDNVPENATILSFDTIVQPYNKGHLMPKGRYRLAVIVSAANARPREATLEISLSGDWYEDEGKMFRQGVGLRLVESRSI